MELQGQNISVIGAGIGGLAAAIALAQKGARVQVFEQAEALGEVGAGLQISANGVAVLAALGLREAAEQFANTPEAVVLRDYRGAQVARLPMGESAHQKYGQPFWQFHRADLLGVLENAAIAAGVELVFGHTLSHVSQSGALGFENGKTVQSDGVIGADGVRSTVRKQVFAGLEARFTGQVAWRGLVESHKLPKGLFENAAQVFMGKGRHLVAYPLRGGSLINFVAVEARKHWAEEGWNIADDPQNLRAAFKGFAAPVQTLLAAVDHTFLWGLFNHPVLPSWANGRVALLGDACHPMLPFLAQGAVMGLEDAYVLADELGRADNFENGLKAYELKRKARTLRVQNGAARNAWSYHLSNPLVRSAAHGVLSILPSKALLGQFDWLYGHDVTDNREG